MENPLETPENFEFPYQPYQIQLEFMRNLYSCIENRQLGIFESPTGTGKSLSIICGALRWLKDHDKHKRVALEERIQRLEFEKENGEKSSKDWLTTQSKQIELNYEINNLKIQLKRIVDYDDKIEKLKKETKTKNIYKNPDNKEIDLETTRIDNTDDDNLLLQETIDENGDDEDSDDGNEAVYENTKIFICSRTHSQLSQFIGEIIKSPFNKNVRVAILASRQTFCINPSVKQLKHNSLINEKCLDLQNKQLKKVDNDGKVLKKRKENCKCPYFKQNSIERLRNDILTDIEDIEDLIKKAKFHNSCPYYASRLACKDAEIILVPYQTILHKPTREANGIKLKNNILIIDEAHNLLETMAQIHSAELNLKQVDDSLQQLKFYKARFNTRLSAFNLLHINQLMFVLNKLRRFIGKFDGDNRQQVFKVEEFVISAEIDNYNMFKLVKFCKDSRIAHKVRNYAVKYPQDLDDTTGNIGKTGVKEFLKSIQKSNENNEPIQSETKLIRTSLLTVITFLESLTYNYNDARIFTKHQTLQFFLLNPSENFREIIKEVRSVIVAGGTMRPTIEFRQRLFVNCGVEQERIIEFTCDHIIPPDNILPIILTTGLNNQKLCFNYETRLNMIANIKQIIAECCERITGGIVVFFPSYSYEHLVYNELKKSTIKQRIFREPKESNQVETTLKQYSDVIAKDKRALLLSVVGIFARLSLENLGGKLSEGLNFSDDLGRCIIVVGLPYANITALDLREKMTYLDRIEGTGAGRNFYVNLCMKAVNQSIGRAVRHKNDYATILLIDDRYNSATIKNLLPNWIQQSLEVCNCHEMFKNIEKFFDDKNKCSSIINGFSTI